MARKTTERKWVMIDRFTYLASLDREYMAAIAAERVVRQFDRAGSPSMKKPSIVGGAALGRGFEGGSDGS
jgi:hypothetical protein